MSSVEPSATNMSMASLYALMGSAMPTGAAAGADGASTPALAMIAASNQSAAMEVGTLMQSMASSSTTATGSSSLTDALMSLFNLNPTVELQRLANATGSSTPTSSSAATTSADAASSG